MNENNKMRDELEVRAKEAGRNNYRRDRRNQQQVKIGGKTKIQHKRESHG
jgi:hypothetical protein